MSNILFKKLNVNEQRRAIAGNGGDPIPTPEPYTNCAPPPPDPAADAVLCSSDQSTAAVLE